MLLELMCARMLLPAASDDTEGLAARLDRLERRMDIQPARGQSTEPSAGPLTEPSAGQSAEPSADQVIEPSADPIIESSDDQSAASSADPIIEPHEVADPVPEAEAAQGSGGEEQAPVEASEPAATHP